MFSQVSVCPQEGLGLCPGGSPSWGKSPFQGVSVQGVPCPGQGGSLSRVRGFSVQGRGSPSKGVLCPGGSLSRGLCPGGSLSRRVSVQGGLCPGSLCHGDPRTVTSGQYASY